MDENEDERLRPPDLQHQQVRQQQQLQQVEDFCFKCHISSDQRQMTNGCTSHNEANHHPNIKDGIHHQSLEDDNHHPNLEDGIHECNGDAETPPEEVGLFVKSCDSNDSDGSTRDVENDSLPRQTGHNHGDKNALSHGMQQTVETADIPIVVLDLNEQNMTLDSVCCNIAAKSLNQPETSARQESEKIPLAAVEKQVGIADANKDSVYLRVADDGKMKTIVSAPTICTNTMERDNIEDCDLHHSDDLVFLGEPGDTWKTPTSEVAFFADNLTTSDSILVKEKLLEQKRYDRRSITSISSDSKVEMNTDHIGQACPAFSQSVEKISLRSLGNRDRFYPNAGFVRSSRSQENYFVNSDITCVDIDLDDNIASSVDALHYDTSSLASLESMGLSDWLSDHLEMDVIEDSEILVPHSSLSSAKVVTPGINSFDNSSLENSHKSTLLQHSNTQVSRTKTKDSGLSALCIDEHHNSSAVHGIARCINANDIEASFESGDSVTINLHSRSANDNEQKISQVPPSKQSEAEPTGNPCSPDSVGSPDESTVEDELDKDNGDCDPTESSGDSFFDFSLLEENSVRHPIKDIDRPSAARLAKRLFYLQGFRKSDVSRHLSKKNSFAQLVGEEYLKYFDFGNESLEGALRKFIRQLTLVGETQDRERLLLHFSHRYHQCNPDVFKSEDCCHTLACAMLLLNCDLHGQNLGRKLTLLEFMGNLVDMNDGEQFPKDLLKSIYQSIKSQPLLFEPDEKSELNLAVNIAGNNQISMSNQTRYMPASPFLDVPDPNNAIEFKKGYVMRKCCVEPDGRKTPLGKRGWKMFYATLRDLVLYMHIDEHGFKRGHHFNNANNNTIHVYHSLANKATDYVKKNHVFRLQTADMAQYLIQTSDSKECQEWIDSINFVAASYSAPVQAVNIGSKKRFERPLMPSSYTRLNLREQINQHEKMVAEYEKALLEHRKFPPEKGAKSRIIQDYCKKENYLKFELKRYKTYCRLLQYKMAAFPELEPCLAEIAIGEVDETAAAMTQSLSDEFIPTNVMQFVADSSNDQSSLDSLPVSEHFSISSPIFETPSERCNSDC